VSRRGRVVSVVAIDADDHEKGVPIRTLWSRNMYTRLSYAGRLAKVRAPTLILEPAMHFAP